MKARGYFVVCALIACLVCEFRVAKTRRPWQRWQPWAVVAGGAAAGLVGGVLYWRADKELAGEPE